MAFSHRLFFDHLRAGILGPTLDPQEVSGCEAILAAFAGFPLADVAYALGTAYLETAGTMQPVREAYWLSDAQAEKYFMKMYDVTGARPKVAKALGNTKPGDGAKYPGMGYPQTTGLSNYQKAQDVFGIPFVDQPKLMMKSENAAKVMAHFMKSGLFTGKRLADYLPRSGPATFAQFKSARPIINGSDRAADVATFAMKFQPALQAGGWQ